MAAAVGAAGSRLHGREGALLMAPVGGGESHDTPWAHLDRHALREQAIEAGANLLRPRRPSEWTPPGLPVIDFPPIERGVKMTDLGGGSAYLQSLHEQQDAVFEAELEHQRQLEANAMRQIEASGDPLLKRAPADEAELRRRAAARLTTLATARDISLQEQKAEEARKEALAEARKYARLVLADKNSTIEELDRAKALIDRCRPKRKARR